MKESELITKITELENKIFMVDMIDRWTDEDRQLYQKLNKELKILQQELDNTRTNPKPKPQDKQH